MVRLAGHDESLADSPDLIPSCQGVAARSTVTARRPLRRRPDGGASGCRPSRAPPGCVGRRRLAAVVGLYQPLLLVWVRMRGVRPSDAPDVVQDIFAKLILTLPHFRLDPTRGQFRNWLWRVTYNAATNWVCRRAAWARAEEAWRIVANRTQRTTARTIRTRSAAGSSRRSWRRSSPTRVCSPGRASPGGSEPVVRRPMLRRSWGVGEHGVRELLPGHGPCAEPLRDRLDELETNEDPSTDTAAFGSRPSLKLWVALPSDCANPSQRLRGLGQRNGPAVTERECRCPSPPSPASRPRPNC